MQQPSISGSERIYSLDVIRGIALLGILLVNMPEYAHLPGMHSGVNAYVRLFFDLFVQTKFYTIFSFLFGVGFFIFMDRAAARGERVNVLFSRRLLALFAFGLFHLFFFWGDILHFYAAVGFFLLAFFSKSERAVLITALALLVFSMLPAVIMEAAGLVWEEQSSQLSANDAGFLYNGLHTIRYVLMSELSSSVQLVPEILGLFLLGLYCGKKQVFQRIAEYRSQLQTLRTAGLLLTIPFWIMIVFRFAENESYGMFTAYSWVLFSGKTLALFYVTSIMLLLERPEWRLRLASFAAIGKMALTTYLTQTLVWDGLDWLLRRWGLTIDLLAGAVLCLLLFAGQIWFARKWLRHFRFGPAEWLWRLLTYGRRQPLFQKER